MTGRQALAEACRALVRWLAIVCVGSFAIVAPVFFGVTGTRAFVLAVAIWLVACCGFAGGKAA